MVANEVCVQSRNSIFSSFSGMVAGQTTLHVHGGYKIMSKHVQMALEIVANEFCVLSPNFYFFLFFTICHPSSLGVPDRHLVGHCEISFQHNWVPRHLGFRFQWVSPHQNLQKGLKSVRRCLSAITITITIPITITITIPMPTPIAWVVGHSLGAYHSKSRS